MRKSSRLPNMGAAAILVLSFMLAACGAGDGFSVIDLPSDVDSTISGVAQKGPFAENAKVFAYRLTANGSRGPERVDSFTGQDGRFSITVPWAGATEIEVSGDYLDELTGEFGHEQSTLASVVNADGSSAVTANVNILTHLVASRAKLLMLQGDAFPLAVEKARSDVRARFYLSGNAVPADLDLTDRTIGEATDSANLLLISASTLAAGLSQLDLHAMSVDFSTDGFIDGFGQGAFDQIRAAAIRVDLDSSKSILVTAGHNEAPGFADLNYLLPPWVGAPIELNAEVHVLTAPELGGLVSVSQDRAVLEFDAETGIDNLILPNDIIVGEPTDALPDGILRRVISVLQQGAIIRVDTRSATLEDLILQGSFFIRIPLTQSNVDSIEMGPSVLLTEMSDVDAGKSAAASSEAQDCELIVDTGFLAELETGISLQGSLASCAYLELDAEFDLVEGLQRLSLQAQLHNTLSANIVVPSSVDARVKEELIRIGMRPLAVTVPTTSAPGEFPVVVSLSIPLIFDADALADSGIEASVFSSGWMRLETLYADALIDSSVDASSVSAAASVDGEHRFSLDAGFSVSIEPSFYSPTPISESATEIGSRTGVDVTFADSDYPSMLARSKLVAFSEIYPSQISEGLPVFDVQTELIDALTFISEVSGVRAVQSGDQGTVFWNDAFAFPSGSGMFKVWVGEDRSAVMSRLVEPVAAADSPLTISAPDSGSQYFAAVSAVDAGSGVESQMSEVAQFFSGFNRWTGQGFFDSATICTNVAIEEGGKYPGQLQLFAAGDDSNYRVVALDAYNGSGVYTAELRLDIQVGPYIWQFGSNATLDVMENVDEQTGLQEFDGSWVTFGGGKSQCYTPPGVPQCDLANMPGDYPFTGEFAGVGLQGTAFACDN